MDEALSDAGFGIRFSDVGIGGDGRRYGRSVPLNGGQQSQKAVAPSAAGTVSTERPQQTAAVKEEEKRPEGHSPAQNSDTKVLPAAMAGEHRPVSDGRVYEKNRNRRKREFQDLDYICCSNLGRARSKGFHCRYYKQILAENGLPDIRWQDLRSTYCMLLLKESFNPKAVSKLMGHAKELITRVYERGITEPGRDRNL